MPEGTPEDQGLTPADPVLPDADEVVEGEAVPADPARQIIERFQILEAKLHRGPLPSPETLREYESAMPGCAERIVSQFEGQSAHRQSLERRMVDANIKSRFLAQGISFFVVVLGIVAGTLLILEDKDVAGLAAILTPLGVIAIRLLRSGRDDEPLDDGLDYDDEAPDAEREG